MCRLFVSPSNDETPGYLTKWGRDLGLTLTTEQREKILGYVWKTSISTKRQEFGVQIPHKVVLDTSETVFLRQILVLLKVWWGGMR